MGAVETFNGLNGSVVSRARLGKLMHQAISQNQPHLARRLRAALDQHKESKFEIGLSAFEFEAADTQSLFGLEWMQEKEIVGLGKPVAQKELYDYITKLIIDTIEEVGHLPWQKDWTGSGSGNNAKNYVTKKEYSGINYVMLNFDIAISPEGKAYLAPIEFKQPYYLTMKQIEAAGAQLRKGSRHRKAFYYTMVFDYRSETLNFKTSDQKAFATFVKENGLTRADLDQNLIKIPVIKYYRVFRADHCTGLKFPEAPIAHVDPIDSAQAIIDGYPNPPRYTFGGDEAFYMPASDVINMPVIGDFQSPASYYCTFFHEQIHSTGHAKRLNRNFDTKTSKKDYAFEELVAELGAVYLCAQAGTLFHTRANSAKYLAGWNRKLVSELKKDNRFFLKAAALAQKAADHILNAQTKTKSKAQSKAAVSVRAQKADVEKAKEIEEAIEKEPKAYKKETKAYEKPKKAYENALKRKRDRHEDAAQLELALKGPAVDQPQPETTVFEKTPQAQPKTTHEKVTPGSLADLLSRAKEDYESYRIENPEIARFLGDVEIKPKESLVVTLAGDEGSGKTRALFQFMNEFAQHYRCGHASMEEHPSSKLYRDKAVQYLNAKALNNIQAPPEIRTAADLEKLIRDNDVIFIDSFAKLRELIPGAEIDSHLRKKYDGKLFVVIFQLTADGKMRGGSKSQYDGDIILSTEKFNDYKDNFVFPTKNRYNETPRDQLKWSIYNGKMLPVPKPALPTPELKPAQPIKFSFAAIERA